MRVPIRRRWWRGEHQVREQNTAEATQALMFTR